MNIRDHMLFGFLSGSLLGIFLCNLTSDLNLNFIAFSSFFSGFGSIFPDSLEPASSWNHRGFFHSQRVLGVLTLFSFLLSITCSLWPPDIHVLFAFGFTIGYLSHLLSDAITPIGLPP
ncbi:MAG: metal-dependent hydrolase [Candidatus Hodarchaeales archaeon]